jgi:HSP20 family molecular chaperone IbpA
MSSQHSLTHTPIPYGPSENGRRQLQQQPRFAADRDYRRRVSGAVRTLLMRQGRAYGRCIRQLQEQCHQLQMKMYQPNDLTENDSMIRLTLDVPGVSKDDIQVQVLTTLHELRVTSKRLYMSIDGKSCVGSSTKCRRYYMNNDVVDVSQISATLGSGTLTITAPKKAKTTISINERNQSNGTINQITDDSMSTESTSHVAKSTTQQGMKPMGS